jgi:site-specific DNA-methyltransferase (adenine-specific)
MVSVDKGQWDRSAGINTDHDFHLRWLGQCQRVLKRDGTIWVSGTQHNVYSVGFAMQQLGFKMLNDIIWHKRNPPPNLSCRYFTHATETILWAARDKASRHRFNYPDMKSANGGKQMQNVWSILPASRSEKTLGKHPTQKPLALLERIILASTLPGDLILDPFNGSGTTGIAAQALGRRYLGMELDPQYLELTLARYREAQARQLAPAAEGQLVAAYA